MAAVRFSTFTGTNGVALIDLRRGDLLEFWRWSVLQNLSQLREAFGDQANAQEALIVRAEWFFDSYAFLEEKVLGETPLLFPEYLLGMDLPDELYGSRRGCGPGRSGPSCGAA